MNTLVIKDQVHKSPQKYIFFEKKVETLFLLSTLKKKEKGRVPGREDGHWSAWDTDLLPFTFLC